MGGYAVHGFTILLRIGLKKAPRSFRWLQHRRKGEIRPEKLYRHMSWLIGRFPGPGECGTGLAVLSWGWGCSSWRAFLPDLYEHQSPGAFWQRAALPVISGGGGRRQGRKPSSEVLPASPKRQEGRPSRRRDHAYPIMRKIEHKVYTTCPASVVAKHAQTVLRYSPFNGEWRPAMGFDGALTLLAKNLKIS